MHVGEENVEGDFSDIFVQIEEYRNQWQKATAGPEGLIAKWADGLSTDDAIDIASWIVDTYDRLSAARHEDG